MKTKTKNKFDLNETIRNLEAITKGFQESAERMKKLAEKIEQIENLKKESFQVVEDQRNLTEEKI